MIMVSFCRPLACKVPGRQRADGLKSKGAHQHIEALRHGAERETA